MCEPCKLNVHRYAAQLTDINNYIPFLPGVNKTKNVEEMDLIKILLKYVPKIWPKQAYLQGFDAETKTFQATVNLFKMWYIAEDVYKVIEVKPAKTIWGCMLTMWIYSVTIRKEKLSRLSNPIRSTMASARQKYRKYKGTTGQGKNVYDT